MAATPRSSSGRKGPSRCRSCAPSHSARQGGVDRWEFAHANVRRRRGAAGPLPSSGTRAGGGGKRGRELEGLRRDQEALAKELARLRRGKQKARVWLLDMEHCVRGTEQRQEHCTAFLARDAGSPTFLDDLLLQRHGDEPLEAAGRKRRLLNAATTAPDVATEVLTFEELALAADAEIDAPLPTVSASTTDMIWYELLGRSRRR